MTRSFRRIRNAEKWSSAALGVSTRCSFRVTARAQPARCVSIWTELRSPFIWATRNVGEVVTRERLPHAATHPGLYSVHSIELLPRPNPYQTGNSKLPVALLVTVRKEALTR